MILHSISIRDWKNIGRLELNALDAPLIVLHGPNRTGKSSIVEAIRCCLFDCDHDSGHTSIRNAVPWTTQATPQVTVEFAAGGTRYRLKKCFSKRKDGEATLERRSPGGEWSVVERGKEAAREARTILGGVKSDEGLNQLLWLSQGVTVLPESKSLDSTLRKRFEQVLGSLLTAQDIDFQELLSQRCGAYFSVKTGKDLKKSPLGALRARSEDVAATVAGLSRNVGESESLVAEFDSLQERIADDRKLLADSEETLMKLRDANAAVESKRRTFADAQRSLTEAQKHHEQAQAQLDTHSQLRTELAELEKQVRGATSVVDTAGESREGVTAKIAQRDAALQDVRRQLAEAERGRAKLDDKRRLTELADQTHRLCSTRDECGRLDGQIAERRRELADILAADDKTLKTLRKNRQEADKLRAVIDAAALKLEIECVTDAALQLSLDAETPDHIDLPPGELRGWQFRQWMEVRIGSFGTIRVVRGEQNVSLDEAARQLGRLDNDFADALAGFGLGADDEQWRETLAARGVDRDQSRDRLVELERRRDEIAPDGSEAIQRELDRLESERRAVLVRSPGLSDWTPDAGEVRSAEQALSNSTADLRKTETKLVSEMDDLRTEESRAKDNLSDHKEKLATLAEKRNGAQRELQALGDEFTLRQDRDAAAARMEQARTQVEANALTPDEEQLQQKIEQEEEASRNRRERLQDTEKQAHGIRERLKDRAGLHEQLADAEAELARTQSQLEREELNVDAHRLLLQTFEACRNERMQRTVGPLENRVIDWASRLGLGEYRNVSFGDNDYLPTGLSRRDSETLVTLADESFGTIEQLALLIRLAAGQLLAKDDRHVAILDDPLTHADASKHRAMLDILEEVTRENSSNDGTGAAPLQLLVFTCHPERFDHLREARQINLAQIIDRS
jgi:DNA repair exonuclease SbcCD ATPase subunit